MQQEKPVNIKVNDMNRLITKLPPQDIELEKIVLGAIIVEPSCLTEVIEVLKKDQFYLSIHQVIYQAISNLFKTNSPIDLITVRQELKSMGKLDFVGGVQYISELTSKVASAANLDYYVQVILQKYILREIISVAQKTQNEAYDPTTDALTLLDTTEKNIFDISQKNINSDFSSLEDLVTESVKLLDENKDKEHEGITGVHSGFPELDIVTTGWQKSDLIIIAGRPGTGKTAFTLSCIRNAAIDHNIPVALFSLEMSSLQLVTRIISSESEIEQHKLRRSSLKEDDWHKLHDCLPKLNGAPIFIDDSASLNIFEFRAKCRRLKQKHDIQLIVIDYLQLMHSRTDNTKNMNREQEISTISRSLKQVAKELNIPIIALSQMSRDVERRFDSKYKPQLSDLRESGAIEQDADIVLFLYRPEIHKIKQDELGYSTKGICHLMIEKHRNGELADIKVKFIDKFVKFSNIEPEFNMIPSDDANVFSGKTKQSKANDEYVPF